MNEIMDIVIVSMLSVAIFFGYRLSQKVNVIQSSKKELANLFKSFDDTIIRAQKSVDDLKKASYEASVGLQKQIDHANILMDDLSFMAERAVNTANKLENALSDSRAINIDDNVKRKPKKAAFPSSLSPEEVKRMRSENKRTNFSPSAIQNEPASGDKSSQQKNKAEALEILLDKMAKERGKNQSSSSESKSGKTILPRDDEAVVNALKSLGYGKKKDKDTIKS
ncbi:DUF6468 domain-containing protein [Rickettsiales bacterium]|nr:DUF6468 domain-containing protein [Rickettsiales bacterium]